MKTTATISRPITDYQGLSPALDSVKYAPCFAAQAVSSTSDVMNEGMSIRDKRHENFFMTASIRDLRSSRIEIGRAHV